MKLIDNWKKAWRMASVQVAAGAIAFGALPSEVQATMLGAVGLPVTAVPIMIGGLMLIARLVNQPKVQ